MVNNSDPAVPMDRRETNYHVTISKEELSKLPATHFAGKIHVVERAEDVKKALRTLRKSDVVGFDTETRPSFKKGQHHVVALLQLSTRTQAFLFRLNRIGMTDEIKAFLEDENVHKIGLSLHDDFHNLNKLRELEPQGFIDLQPFVKQYNIADNSLSRIYAVIFGKRISKSQQLTNWEAERLTPAQQAYASLDALACIHIYDEITSGRFIPEENPYYREIPPAETL